jgi:hypothetical protein
MVVPSCHPIRKISIGPLAVLVTRNRFIGNTQEQCTVAGEPVMGAVSEDGIAGAHVACTDMGSECVLTGAGIPLIAGVAGNQYAWVQTDANGMAIPWAGGAANTAGKIYVAAAAGGELVEVHFESKAAPVLP